MSRDEELAEQLNNIITGDNEVDHCKADDILIEALKELGYTKLVEAYEEASERFWYA